MVSLYKILDLVQDYIGGCEGCEACKTGTCAWLKHFSPHESSLIHVGCSYEERARNLHRRAGYPPCNRQCTFRQYKAKLMRLVGEARGEDMMPRNESDLRAFLLRVAQTKHLIEQYLEDEIRVAFLDASMYGLIVAMGALDYYFLEKKHMDYLELFLSYFPEYHRQEGLSEYSYDSFYIDECLTSAHKIHLGGAEIEVSVAGNTSLKQTVSTVTGHLAHAHEDLSSTKAMTVWNYALAHGWVTEDYEWCLGKQEKALFAGRFSQFFYNEKRVRWRVFRTWDDNCNYARDFNVGCYQVQCGEANQNMMAISSYFDSIDKVHSLSI